MIILRKYGGVNLRIILKLLPWFIVFGILLIGPIILLFLAMSAVLVLGFAPGPASVNALPAISSFAFTIIQITVISPLLIIIISTFPYLMSYFILYDEPNLSAKEIVEKSASLMVNNKWRFFCLNLSFIGWAILSVYTFGIGFLFLAPYMQIANIHFYEDLANKTTETTNENNDGNAIKEM